MSEEGSRSFTVFGGVLLGNVSMYKFLCDEYDQRARSLGWGLGGWFVCWLMTAWNDNLYLFPIAS